MASHLPVNTLSRADRRRKRSASRDRIPRSTAAMPKARSPPRKQVGNKPRAAEKAASPVPLPELAVEKAPSPSPPLVPALATEKAPSPPPVPAFISGMGSLAKKTQVEPKKLQKSESALALPAGALQVQDTKCPGKPAGTDQRSSSKRRTARIAPQPELVIDSPSSKPSGCARTARPLSLDRKALTHSRNNSVDTPALTPHTLTDAALRKSESLLAQLVALGLSDIDEINLTDSQREDAASIVEDAIRSECLSQYLRSECTSPIHAALTPKATDTVEVPIALLNMFMENLSKCRDSQILTEANVDIADASHQRKTSSASTEPEPEVTPTTTTFTDAATSMGDNESEASTAPDSSQVLRPSPPASPLIVPRTTSLHAAQLTASPPIAPRSLAHPVCRMPSVQRLKSSASTANTVVDARVARRPVACTIQQNISINVTNTVQLHF